jgi:hypothetical protein
MRHLPSMRTPVRFGITDGAINVSFAAVGKSLIEATTAKSRHVRCN